MSTIEVAQLRALAVFALVIEGGSFAEAARRLGSSRSRVSEQIAALEQQLGVRLIQRSTRKLSVTAEGKAVYEQARLLPDILTEVARVTQQEQPCGRVSLTVNVDVGINHLLPVLREFEQRYPEIELDLILDDERRDLIAEQIDLSIRVGIPQDSSLIARVLHREAPALFASRAYLQRAGTPQTIEALNHHHWVDLKLSSVPPVMSVQHLYHQGAVAETAPVSLQPAFSHRCNSPLMVQQMVQAGMGIGLLLPATVQPQLAAGLLVPVCPQLRGKELTFALVYPSRHQLPLRTRCLVEHLLAAELF
ncbi:MAG: LysR family transcriptional regulator [Marinobacterium sp.]|nr:LysR family transcriptional regulator [Marinobacterium sp.]